MDPITNISGDYEMRGFSYVSPLLLNVCTDLTMSSPTAKSCFAVNKPESACTGNFRNDQHQQMLEMCNEGVFVKKVNCVHTVSK